MIAQHRNLHSKYSSTSTIWRQRGLKREPRSDLDYLTQRAFLSTWVGTILHILLIE